MREKFKELQQKNPELSTAMVFTKLIRGRKMAKGEILKWFNRLVEKEDYSGREKREVLSWMFNFSNGLK